MKFDSLFTTITDVTNYGTRLDTQGFRLLSIPHGYKTSDTPKRKVMTESYSEPVIFSGTTNLGLLFSTVARAPVNTPIILSSATEFNQIFGSWR